MSNGNMAKYKYSYTELYMSRRSRGETSICGEYLSSIQKEILRRMVYAQTLSMREFIHMAIRKR